MDATFSRNQVSALKKEIRGMRIMKNIEAVCADKRVAQRATVYKALNSERYDDDNPVHRLIIALSIEVVRQNDGDLSMFESPAELQAA